jgi:hypothetical protein
VVNCAADYSDNYHEKEGVKYLPLHLKDHVRENIEYQFYEVIDFMSEAKKQEAELMSTMCRVFQDLQQCAYVT